MRFMMLMIPKGYEAAEPGTVPDAKAVEAMMKYNEDLLKAGVLLSLDGLHPPSAGVRVSFAGGKPTVTDGPFAESKEVLGGYWMIRVNSQQEAVDWAKRCPGSANEIIEIRQVQEMEDFPEDVQKAAEGFDEMQAKAAHRRPAGRLVARLRGVDVVDPLGDDAEPFWLVGTAGSSSCSISPPASRLRAEAVDDTASVVIEQIGGGVSAEGEKKSRADSVCPRFQQQPQGRSFLRCYGSGRPDSAGGSAVS